MLSENAVAVLRFEIKGYRSNSKDRRQAAYRELSAAGIMEPVPGSERDYRFTEDAWERREEILEAAVDHLHSLEPRLSDRIELSDTARDVLRRHLNGDEEVTDSNRSAYRELARVGIMFPVSGFATGPESRFRFTKQGWERRIEFSEPALRPAGSP